MRFLSLNQRIIIFLVQETMFEFSLILFLWKFWFFIIKNTIIYCTMVKKFYGCQTLQIIPAWYEYWKKTQSFIKDI